MPTSDLNHDGFQDALVSKPSLMELDPSPIESPNVDDVAASDKEMRLLPEDDEGALPDSLKSAKTGTTTSSVGLSGTGHSAIYYLTRIQRYSSYTLTIFTTLHLATTGVIPLITRAVPSSESYLLLAREFYQTPLSEPLLVLLPAVAHVTSGLALRVLRRAQNVRRYGRTPGVVLPLHRGEHSKNQRIWPPLSWISVSGYIFTVSLGLHAFVNRILPVLVEGDSSNIGLAYVSHGFARHPVTAWITYGTMLAAGCGHMVWGWARWMGWANKAGLWTIGTREVRRSERRAWLMINGAVVLVTGLWAAGGLGIVARGGATLGWVGKVYDGLFDKIPLL